MSSIVIKGNTSGQVEIAAPDVAGSTTLTLPTGNGTVITDTAPKAGNVLQVVSTTKTDTFSSSTGGFTDITGLSVSITPISTSSKILVMWNVDVGHSSTSSGVKVRMVRDSTPISIGDQVGTNRARGTSAMFTLYSNVNNTSSNRSGTYLDSPSTTSAITYKAQGSITGGTYYVNRTGEYNDQAYESTGTSTITVMEIAG